MQSEPTKATERNAGSRKSWRRAFCIGAVFLILCLVVIVANPVVGTSSQWYYWLALGSAILCAVAAVQLWSYGRFDAADEGAWLARVGTRSSKDSWDDLGGVDD